MEKLTIGILLCVFVGAVISTDDCLYLTDDIERGNTVGAKLLSRVYDPYLVLNDIRSYSGYLTVNKAYNSNLFFWFYEAKNNAAKAPVILWLQGGPGASSLYGMLMENGPFGVNSNGKAEARKYTWQQNYNMLYIDNPVGAGFSFTDNAAGYATNEVDVGNNLFSAVRQIGKMFPEFFKNGFYITGESYAGKYIPALGHAIYSKRQSTDPWDRINLKGLAIGNGVTDPVHQILFGEYFYQLGFIDSNALAIFNQYQTIALQQIAVGNYTGAMLYTFSLINTPTCLFNNLTGFTSPYNYLRLDGYNPAMTQAGNFMLNSGIKKYLHVGNRTWTPFADKNTVLGYLQGDIMDSVAPWVQELIDNYRVFIYNGNLDLLISPTLTHNYLSYLTFNGYTDYKVAKRNFWYVNSQLAGYYKKAGGLTEVTVRNAGHMVPYDQPEVALDLINKLTGPGF